MIIYVVQIQDFRESKISSRSKALQTMERAELDEKT